MSKHLLIVESPAKSKTINKYLGKDFKVLASYGHVRDLVPREGAVDTENGFRMQYELIDRNRKHVDEIARAMQQAEDLYLATDLDREGEAISWHLVEILRERGLLEGKKVYRVVFSEITPKAIQEAIANPRELNLNLVDAQQARRALDYLVGFNLSPLLWKKVNRGLSAGRVQSPALRMIVEREEEIERFQPQEYWTVEAALEREGSPFKARLTHFEGEKLEQFSITDGERAAQVEQALNQACSPAIRVERVKKSQRKRNPAPPFITSTLQQEAARKLGFSAQRTMRTAQQLYEGVALDGTQQGLITYMRTDSVHLADEAVAELRQAISRFYGDDHLPEKPNRFRTKSKNAQEAHEAIRPTSALRRPEDIRSFLTPDQYKLYDLIWKRTLACQMIHATIHTVAADLLCPCEHRFRANGSVIANPGFLRVYEEGRDDGRDDGETRLPPLEEGEMVTLKQILTSQHFTEPPPRFTEASLVKALEEYGIGRPSTYASIISTLLNREYVELDRKRFVPTDTGRVVSRFLSNHFGTYVDYDFTARLEDELDAISRGEEQMEPLLREFWEPFHRLVSEKEESVSRDEAKQARVLGEDPETGKPVSVRLGRYGPYVQIGTRDDEDKPRFASLRPGQKMDSITLEEALELFRLPRVVGTTEDGQEITANIGRFGPYVKYGSKYVSLGDHDPHTVDEATARELIRAKEEADAQRVIRQFEGTDVAILRGRWGPYITDGNKNARIPKDVEPEDLDLETCRKLLAEAPERRRGKKKAGKKTVGKKTASKKKTGRKKAAGKKKTASG